MSDKIDTSFEAVELLAFQSFTGDPATLSGTLRALRAERDAERQRAEKAEAEKKTYESGWLEAEGIISDLKKQVEKAEAERDRLRQAAQFVHGLPPGEWETWDSCSFRRISSRGSCRDGDVLHGIVHRSDGHPDLSWDDKTCWALCHLVNSIRAALRQDEEDDE